MKMSEGYINKQLSIAQQLLWGGSETENIRAHNMIAKLLTDLGVDMLEDGVIESDEE